MKNEYEGITIKEYQLYCTQENQGSLSLFSPCIITHHPFIRFFVEKNIYEELSEKKDGLRTELQLLIESIARNFTTRKGMLIEIIGYDEMRDLHGDDISENGYFVTITFRVEN